MDIVVLYVDPITMCSMARVNRECRDMATYARRLHQENPYLWIGERDGKSMITRTKARTKYHLSKSDLSKLCNVNHLFDENQVARLSFAKYGGPINVGKKKSTVTKKRETISECLRKKLGLENDDRWQVCSEMYQRNGKGGIRGIKTRLERYDNYEKLKNELDIDDTWKFDFLAGTYTKKTLRKHISQRRKYAKRVSELEIAMNLLNLPMTRRIICYKKIHYNSVNRIIDCERFRIGNLLQNG